MKISWYGQSCFKIKCKNIEIVIDPYDKNLGLKLPKIKADLALVNHDHYDHNNTKELSGNPIIINSPGEYEIKETFIYGQEAYHDNNKGSKLGVITMYLIDDEKVRLAHLSDLGQKELSDKQLDFLDSIDVLLIPIGGKYTLSAPEAVSLIKEIEPRIVIPMHYKISGLKEDLAGVDEFIKEIGLVPEKTTELKVEQNKLPGGDIKLVILEQSH